MNTAARRSDSLEPAWALVSPRWNGKLAIQHRDDLPKDGMKRGEIIAWVSGSDLKAFGVDEADLNRLKAERREGAVR